MGNVDGELFNLPVFWMTSIWYRRLRVLTLGDFFAERYGSKRMAGFYAMCQIIFFIMFGAFGLMSMAKTVAAITQKPESELTSTERVKYLKAVELETLQAEVFAMISATEKERLTELQMLKPKKTDTMRRLGAVFLPKQTLYAAIAIQESNSRQTE